MISTIDASGRVGLRAEEADALAAFRAFNYDHIYLRPESVDQAQRVTRLLRSLTDWFIERPEALGDGTAAAPGSPEAAAAAVRYVSGMTDRFALTLAVDQLGWEPAELPVGV